jgi:hypothetical protein
VLDEIVGRNDSGRKGGDPSLAEVTLQMARAWKAPFAVQAQGPARGLIKEIKRHSYYLKPGEKKRTKAALAASGIVRNAPEIRIGFTGTPQVVASPIPFPSYYRFIRFSISLSPA